MAWSCSFPQSVYVMYVNNSNLTLLPSSYNGNTFIYAFGCFITFFLCEGWKEILWSLFSSSEDHLSSLVLSAVWQSPVFGHLASMRKPYCSKCESMLAAKLHGAQKETEWNCFFQSFCIVESLYNRHVNFGDDGYIVLFGTCGCWESVYTWNH